MKTKEDYLSSLDGMADIGRINYRDYWDFMRKEISTMIDEIVESKEEVVHDLENVFLCKPCREKNKEINEKYNLF